MSGWLPRDPIADYPFPGGDGQDWIANGLALAGEETRWSGRPPLLPAMIALLHRAGALWLLPVALLATFAGLAWAAARFAVPDGARARARRWRVAALFFGAAALLRQGPEIMADVAAVALATAALAAVARDGDGGRATLRAGLLSAFAGLAQPAGLFALPGLALEAARRADRRRRLAPLALAVGLALAPACVWWICAEVRLGGAAGAIYAHASLAGWHPEHLAFYRDALPSALGLPALALVLLGTARAARDREPAARRRFALAAGSAAAVVLFFGVGYDFPARRFVIYLAPLLALGWDSGLEAMRARFGARAAAAALVLSVAAAALPAAGERAFVAWPLPTVEVVLPDAALTVVDPIERLAGHPLAVAVRAEERAPFPLDRARRAMVSATLYLHTGDAADGNELAQALRLGNLARRRGRPLPLGLLPAGLLHAGALEPAGAGAGLDLYFFRPLAEGPTWLVAAAAGSRSAAALAAPTAAPRLPGRRLAAALADADCVDAQLPGRDAALVLFGDERKLAVAALALGTRTGTLLVVPPEAAPRWRAELARLSPARRAACGALSVARVEWKGMTYTVASATPAATTAAVSTRSARSPSDQNFAPRALKSARSASVQPPSGPT